MIAAIDPLPPVGCELTDPLARLLWAMAGAGVLGPKPGAISPPVPPVFRCRLCDSPRTRFKLIRLLPAGHAPATGFELRCRCCGAINRFESASSAEVAA